MMWRPLVLTLGIAVVSAVMVHAALLWGVPNWATDRQLNALAARGANWNSMIHVGVPRAGQTPIPLANPDGFNSRVLIDLAKGPLLVEGPVPKSCVYWSASVFQRNTDVVLIVSERDFPDGHARIGLVREDGRITEPVDHLAKMGSDTGILLLRCFMRDSGDPEHLAQLDAERRLISVRPAR